MPLIAAPRLAERIVGAGHIQNVVDDLEQYAQLGREAPNHIVAGPSTPPNNSTHTTDAPISRPVFSSCNLRSAVAPVGSVGVHIRILPADHPVHSGRARQLRRRSAPVAAPSAAGSADA